MKRESIEGRVTTYFQLAEAPEAVLMFKVIKSILNSRGFELDGRKIVKKRVKVKDTDPLKTQKSNSGDSLKDAGLGLSASSAPKDKTGSDYVHKSN